MTERNRVAPVAAFLAILLAPVFATAQSNLGLPADMQCLQQCARQQQIAQQAQNPSLNCPMTGQTKIPCQVQTVGGTVSGICILGKGCQAMNAPGQGGGNSLDQGMQMLGQILGMLMQKLMQPQPPEPPAPTGGGGGGNMCDTLQPTPDQNLALSNPNCYFYQPENDPTGGLVATPTTGAAPLTVYIAYTNGTTACKSSSLMLHFGDGQTEVAPTHTDTVCSGKSETTQHVFEVAGSYSIRLKNAAGEERGGANIEVTEATSTSFIVPKPNIPNATPSNTTNIGSVLFSTPLTNLNSNGSLTGGSNVVVPATNPNPGATLNFNTPQSIVQSIIQKNVQPGAYGDVKILDNGTTIIAGVRENNSETAGFFGSQSTMGGQGAVQRMCATRPWASNFLSYVIPPSFFDSLCTLRGYAVGGPDVPDTQIPATVKTPVVVTTRPTSTSTPTGTSTTATSNGRVDIWASPASVPLGARTSIFWTSENVTECIETATDGNFSHTSLKGGASTVPLTEATTFTISCTSANGAHVTDSVMVPISL